MISDEATTPSHFNAVARVLHWLMAIMILTMLFLGAGMMTSLTHRPWMINLHRPLGIAILLLVILRLYNRFRHSPPPLPATLPSWQKISAHISHVALYVLMLALPLIGWATLSAAGYPITMFRGLALPPIVPVSAVWYGFLRDAHSVLAWLLFATVLAHLAAALLHGWIHRDGVFASMAKGSRSSGRQSIQPSVDDLSPPLRS
jgi:cytochrome b561